MGKTQLDFYDKLDVHTFRVNINMYNVWHYSRIRKLVLAKYDMHIVLFAN